MPTKVSPLGLRLFMEGIEVPVIAANVTAQPDMPATASIQIIPTDMSLHFLPRTLVHLFYLDSYLTDDEIELARKTVDKTAKVRASVEIEQSIMDRNEMEDFSYKLLFAGEVIGFNYKKTPVGRQLVLQCMDLSSYWDTCYQFFSDYSASGNGLTDKTHQFVGAGDGIFDNLGGHQWVISSLIKTAPKTPEYQTCAGLLGGLIHLLEAIGGLKYRNSSFKGYNGVNDFFTIAELRYGLLSMLGAVTADKTSAKLYAAKAFVDWIRNGMTSIGSLVSFRDILNHINRYIFHNIYPNPCAYYVPGGELQSKRTVKVGSTTFLDAAEGVSIKEDLKKVLTSMVEVLHMLETAISTEGATFSSSSRARTNLVEIHDDLLSASGRVEKSGADNAQGVASDINSIAEDIQSAIDKLPLKESGGGNLSDKVSKALNLVKISHENLDGILNKSVVQRGTKDIKVPGASMLYNQLFLPEAFFVSPPRCNVVFPDQYFDLNYGRNFMREVTRLSCHAGLGMLAGGRQGAQLLGSQYLAPNIRDVRGKLLSASFSQGARVLLPHEVHSGIVPKFEWVTDGHRWGVKAAYASGKGEDLKKSQKIHYLQRLANFQFFLHRWSARQLTISGVFNPNIVAGLPGVIIDRSAPSPAVIEQLEKTLRRRMLPTQFLGKVHSFTHAIGQQGGSTSIRYVYARTHRGLDDEFLGVLGTEIPEEGKEETLVVNTLQLAQGLDPATVSEQEEEESDVRAKQLSRTSSSTTVRKSIVRMWTDKKLKVGVLVPGLGKTKKVTESGTSSLSQTQADLLGISVDYFVKNKKSTDKGDVIDVPEKITLLYTRLPGSGRAQQSSLAVEDAIRPGWFSDDVWKNDKITEAVYKPLLGTMAITDDVSLGQDQQDELLKRWETDQTKRTTTPEGEPGTATVETTSDSKYKYSVVPGSVEESIDGISLVYGLIKERGGNIHEFIRDFTRRPVANMVDILGTQDLEFTDDGKVADSETMIEGFHSRAFGDYNTDVQLPEKEGASTTPGAKALHALMEGVSNPGSLQRPGIIGRDEAKTGIRPELDPRGRARGRVRAYVEELQLSRGLLGS